MPTYRFTGDTEELFPMLPGRPGALLEPGDEIDIPEAVEHPRLELVGDAPPAPPPEPEPEPAPAGEGG